MDFTSIMGLIQTAMIAGGSIWLGIGGIIFALALKNKEAQQIQSGTWQIVGGALILAIGVFFGTITF